ncbi:glycosyltransferase family 61 protein [Roseicyclus sp.]|uniref:glycosyltransferase family 61 protein n=1 Tax=Roseicyclus sp. TaxID=1914329 RepID=UPI001BD18C7B|nr:glycosyltransferase family 61 protein [Roseicyclus sp.]
MLARILKGLGLGNPQGTRFLEKGPYLWPINLLRRRLGLAPNPYNSAGLILNDLRPFEDVGFLADLQEADLAQGGISAPIAQPPDWPKLDLARIRVGSGNSLPGLAKNVVPPPICLITYRNVYFAHRGDRFCILNDAFVDANATALPSYRCLMDLRRNSALRVARLIYCGNQHSPDNPAHFLGDHLSTAILLLDAGFSPSEIFLPATRAPVNQTLQQAINPNLMTVYPDQLYFTEELCLPTSITLPTFKHHPFHVADPSVLAAFANASVGASRGTADRGHLIYLARRKTARRRLENESQLIECLEANGFAAIDMEDLSGPAQLAAMRAAKVIIAPHGGALANLVAARPDASIVELFHPNKGTLAFAVVAARLGLNYQSVVGKACDGDRWSVDIDAVTQEVASLTGGRP